ncbi:glycosyltransferase [Protaetiibacter sp. SSC-01]|uniref:glycosyltransferase n=1 Tax=Protaetiibacter sp. SSC-01 TaxID=2759943 RepID=UPI0016574641|nr:glycosyltransferase [Protaetiibacter sp. SSC-01]QNO37046.1 glycosyltransferase [Protaetiibacter sp. SSC-01]
MSDLPPFSLLLPFYRNDDPAHLERAFRSTVHDQTLRPSEVVLVQDGPVPGGLAMAVARLVADSPVPVRVVTLPENSGLSVALTRGLEEAAHEVVARMDADDVSAPSRFAVQLPHIAEGFDLVGSGMYEFVQDPREGEIILERRVPPLGTEEIVRVSRFQQPFNHPTVVYRRSAVLEAGGYLPMGTMEDYWLFARMIARGARVMNVPEPLVHYRVSSGAYHRRGGIGLLRSELALQRAFRASGFTTSGQYVRNVVVRGGYRLVPVAVRRVAYRRLVARRHRA